jgi:hypothetical protein
MVEIAKPTLYFACEMVTEKASGCVVFLVPTCEVQALRFIS